MLGISQATCAMFLALAHRDLGNEQESEKALETVRTLLEKLEAAGPSQDSNLTPWANRFSALILRRELEGFDQSGPQHEQ
jgi:hypothetical protein